MVAQKHLIDISQIATTEDVLISLTGFIAVVGNAVPSKSYSNEIDNYDNVIRLNNFEIDGYENIIGTKTSLWSTHGSSFIIKEKQDIKQALSPFMKTSVESGDPANNLKIVYAKNNVSQIMNIGRPTTGGALLCLFDYLKIPVTSFCFDFFKGRNYFLEKVSDKSVHTNTLNIEEQYLKSSKYIEFKT